MNGLKKRLIFLKVALLALMMAVVGRLFVIQVLEHDKYVKLAEQRQVVRYEIRAKRGEIYMMDGEEAVPVVMNRKVWTVVVDPALADEERVKEVVDKYAKQWRVTEWSKVFADKRLRYFLVARGIERELAEQIRAERVKGLWLKEYTERVYPEGELGARMLGFVNADGEGQYGVEGALNSELKGKNGILKTVKDVNNIPLTIGNDNVRLPAEDGKKLLLTVDKNIQHATEKVLRKVMKELAVKNASAVVLDPRTGKVWAMADLPGYDPANYGRVKNAEVYQNGVVLDAYEPASVCKTFAFAAGINEGVINPQTTYYNNDTTIVDGWRIDNASKGHTGEITMQKALDWSLNTGSVQTLRLLGGSETEITQTGKEKLYDYYHEKFGLGQATGIELIEAEGIVVPPKDLNATRARYANMTFGQGLNLTMMQVATAFAATVNGGEYFRPTMIGGEVKNGEIIRKNELPKPVRRTVSEKTSQIMREMLVHARRLYRGTKEWDEGLFVGGKTGTAQAIRSGRYVMDETIGSYVGFGSNGAEELPEYVIMTKIWEEGKALGGADAKKIFDEISRYMIDYLGLGKEQNVR